MKYFKDIENRIVEGKKIILDIDGTFLFDKHDILSDENEAKIQELRSANSGQIYLLSNGAKSRTKGMSEILNVSYVDTYYLKPNRKTLLSFQRDELKKDYIVIGDKFLTDGLLALQYSMPFVHVKSMQRSEDGLIGKFVFWIDDVIGQTADFLKLIRPKQWIKNVLVVLPVFFAGQFFDLDIIISAALAFCAFTLAASLIYIVNDYVDKENDKLHHKKRYRPLALSNIGTGFLIAATTILVLLLISVLFIIPKIIPLLVLYIFLNLLYTFKFKHIPVYDVILVSFMYVLRILVGGVATAIYISPWLSICVFFAALFLTCGKRLGELYNPTRKVMKYYSRESLNALLVASGSLAMAAYTLYAITVVKSELAIYSCIIIVCLFFVIINDVLFGSKKIESPETYLLTNRKVVFLIGAWFILEIFRIYISNI